MAKPKAILLAPRRAPAAAVDAFIAGKPGPEQSTSGGRRIVTRRDGRRLVRTTIYMEPELARRLALCAAQVERQQNEIVTEALEEWLARRRE